MKRYLALLLSVVLVVLDQVFKLLAHAHLKPIDTYPIIEDVLHLTYLENRGAAFGMMEGQTWLLIWGTGLILLVMILAVMIVKIPGTLPNVIVCVIIGGGVGNLIDRVYRGYVIDYIQVRFVDFAIFNFADICVVVGVAALVLYIFCHEFAARKKEGKEQKVG